MYHYFKIINNSDSNNNAPAQAAEWEDVLKSRQTTAIVQEQLVVGLTEISVAAEGRTHTTTSDAVTADYGVLMKSTEL